MEIGSNSGCDRHDEEEQDLALLNGREPLTLPMSNTAIVSTVGFEAGFVSVSLCSSQAQHCAWPVGATSYVCNCLELPSYFH